MSRKSKPWVAVIPDADERQARLSEREDRRAREERREALEARAVQARIAELQAAGQPVNLSNLAVTHAEITANALAASDVQDRADDRAARREAEERRTRRQEQREAALAAEHARLIATGDYEAANAVFNRLLAV